MDGISQSELHSDLPPRIDPKPVLLEWNGREYVGSATEVTVTDHNHSQNLVSYR